MPLSTEYQVWQNRFRPEEEGRSDGERNHPAKTDHYSEFEERVKREAERAVHGFCESFCHIEEGLAARFQRVKSAYENAREAYEKKSKQLGREYVPLIARWLSLALMGGFVVIGSVFLFPMLEPLVTGFVWRGILSLLIAVVIGSLAFFLGMLVRQSSPTKGSAAVGIFAVFLVIVLGLLVRTQPHTDQAEQATVYALFFFGALAAMAALSYCSHDEDGEFETLHRNFTRLCKEVTELKGKRDQNRETFLDRGEQIIACAEKVVSVYRQHNKESRTDPTTIPDFMGKPVDYSELLQDQFQFKQLNDL